MGDVGARRSTLVSRLPIFRRSSSKRRDSLPSSPSSATNGVHTSSPSSTNSSSSSVGKRRSIFRTPSIGFHSKKSQEHRQEPRDPNAILPNGVQAPDGAGRKDNVNENPKTKIRHSFGLSVPRSKRITRSATEDFEKGKDLSHNKNVFMNCISSGRSSIDEGDDSGFPDDHSKRSIKQSSRKLLPKSFSTHHKLSKHIARSQSIATAEQPKVSPEVTVDSLRRPVIEEPSKYLQVDNPEGSLHSPLLSSDNTTILTPSEFVPMSADSVSEADKEILLSADPDRGNGQFEAAVAAATPTTVNAPSLGARVLTYAECNVEKETALLSDVVTLETHPYRPQAAPRGQGSPLMVGRLETKDVVPRKPPADLTVEEVASVAHDLSSPQSGPETMNPSIVKTCMLASTNSVPMMKPQEQSQGTSHSTVTMNRTFSPRHEDKWAERRLRSSSEGTSGSRRNHGVRDGRPEDLPCLKKQRADSSSSKMNSMDVLNRLGSCDLDEDDLMLDLECLEDLHHQCESAAAKRFVCREDSNHSIKSCLEILHVPPELKMKLEGPKHPEAANESLCIKEGEHGEVRPTHNNHWLGGPSSDCSLLREEEMAGGLDPLSLRLLMQDCTAVKTMLLKLKRILQESAEMSPASSTHSLPVSPNIEMPFACKDPKDESALLRLQLREKDELISQLREELDSHRSLQKTLALQADKSTQTEILSHELS